MVHFSIANCMLQLHPYGSEEDKYTAKVTIEHPKSVSYSVKQIKIKFQVNALEDDPSTE